jgi:hypothetical protein
MNCSSYGLLSNFVSFIPCLLKRDFGQKMPPSALPPILTPDLMNLFREHPDLPPHIWYIIAAATLTILNRSDEIPKIYEHALVFGPSCRVSRPEHEAQLTILRRMREALVKTSAVGGVPKVCVDILLDFHIINWDRS